MAQCRQAAVLVITGDVEGTTTSLVKRRLTLTCGLPPGHAGAHHDLAHGEQWEGERGDRTTLVRHEDEPQE